MLLFRSYTPDDLQCCLNIFDSNTPAAFSSTERIGFEEFLGRCSIPFFVVENLNSAIVACGGLKFENQSGIAKLRWGMVKRDHHRRGIGTYLTFARLRLVLDHPEIQQVRVGTSQVAVGFYQKIGFIQEKVTPNGILPGFDEYRMCMELDDKRKDRIRSQWKEKNT